MQRERQNLCRADAAKAEQANQRAQAQWENFSIEIIEECPAKKLNERENFWIAALNSKSPNGYNLTAGGEGLCNPSDETRARMSVAQSGENHPFFGKHHTAKTKATIAGKLKGKKRKPLLKTYKKL